MGSKGARADWPALRLEFINGTMTQRALAEAHGINASGVMTRANKEGWEADRQKAQASTAKTAQNRITANRVAELEKMNARDLAISKALASQVVARLNLSVSTNAITPSDELKTLAHVAKMGQDIGRTALGMRDAQPLGGDDGEVPKPVAVVIEFKDARRQPVPDAASE